MADRLTVLPDVLEKLAQIDGHVVKADHRETLGEMVRAAGTVPFAALVARNGGDDDRRALVAALINTAAFSLRVVLSERGMALPAPAQVLALIARDMPSQGRPLEQHLALDPYWARVANVAFRAGDAAHVTTTLRRTA